MENNIIKTPHGMFDIDEQKMANRKDLIDSVKEVFKRHNALEIDTPVCELTEILKKKHETDHDSDKIFNLEGPEKLSLRYDLTIPFARYCVQHGITNMKRFQVGRVYRRDQPNIEKGRLREFYQCDYDCVGLYDKMIPDSECVYILYEIFKNLILSQKSLNFEIKINHRQLLYGIFQECKIPIDLFQKCATIIDKLDKLSKDQVRDELVQFITEDSISLIFSYISMSFEEISRIEFLNVEVQEGISDLKLLFKYLDNMNVPKDILKFDLGMVRGLDYYTGLIYEVTFIDKNGQVSPSVAGGGRYDNLIQMFDPKNRNSVDVSSKSRPCVGLSIGIDRILAFKEISYIHNFGTNVYVATISKNMIQERLKICALLWSNNISVSFSYKENPRILTQFQECEKEQIPICIYFGPDEIKNNNVIVRTYSYPVTMTSEITVTVSKLIETINNIILKL